MGVGEDSQVSDTLGDSEEDAILVDVAESEVLDAVLEAVEDQIASPSVY